MSLEAAIQLNTEALNALTAALLSGKVAAPAAADLTEAPAPKAKGKAPKAEPAAEAPVLEYKDVAPHLLNVGKSGTPEDRAALLKILTKYGAKNGKELKPADYAAVIKDCEAAVAAGA